MLKSETLVFLINSMTRPEKKAFKISATSSNFQPSYVSLFDIISQNKGISIDDLKKEFQLKNTNSSFDATVNYLHKILLNVLLNLRKDQDSYYILFDQIMKARILFEKSLFEECFEILEKVIEDAQKFENDYALLLAFRLELDYLLALNFPFVNEKMLLKKHFKVNETLNSIRKINEQSSLYELLKYRIINYGNIRSNEQKSNLNDLVVSEMSIVASSNIENFQIKKLHQLFQANYLISVGDYKSALRSYIELNTLFEKNKHLWDNPPIYYLLTLEGVLDSLRSIKNYVGMEYFVTQLKRLQSPSVNFNANVTCLIFLYELFPKLDQGNFIDSLTHMKNYTDTLYNKINLLSVTRQAELSLYTALIYFCNKDYRKAHKFLNMIILKEKSYYYLPLYRTIRLINLMILNEMEDFNLISYETRSIKREMKNFDKGYKIEKIMLKFLNRQNLPISSKKRELFWEKFSEELKLLSHDIFEQQVLRIFDFTAWIESKIRRIPLSDTLKSKVNNNFDTKCS